LDDTIEISHSQPQFIFSTELAGTALYHLLTEQGVIEELAAHHYGIALAIYDFSEAQVQAIHRLREHNIYTVAWLMLPPDEGYWFHLQNYPQAVAAYRRFRAWAWQHHLHFDAVGLDIEPPPGEMHAMQHWSLRNIARRMWLARENVLYPAAQAAYSDLLAEMHHDGYEVHVYQIPLIADDRQAGTSIIQRALDVIDLPADLEVLMCYSSLPLDRLGNDLGGALIGSYGTTADSIAVGHTGASSGPDAAQHAAERTPFLSWEALERDVLLAAQDTDIIYISSLEGCVERGMLARIATIDWQREPRPSRHKLLLVRGLRSVLLVVLLFARFYKVLFAWMGWVVAIVLLVQRWQHRRRAIHHHDMPRRNQ
jgi:hypothetical protein